MTDQRPAAPDVIVVGGGIGGLSAAFALTRKGLRVRVLERSAEFGEVGAGIQIAPNCTRILHAYGLLAEAEELGVRPARETGSSVYTVFDGSGTVTVGEKTWSVSRGDLFVVPSWQPFSAKSQAGSTDSDSGALDLFRFSDSPVFEALKLNRTLREGDTKDIAP